jgi:hypothetical protein
MPLSWEDITVTRTNGGADVFCLAGFLRDDNLFCYDGPLEEWIQRISKRTYSELCRFTSSLLPRHTERPIT